MLAFGVGPFSSTWSDNLIVLDLLINCPRFVQSMDSNQALFFRLGIGVLVIAKADHGFELFRRLITFCSSILGHRSWAMFFELQAHSKGSDLVNTHLKSKDTKDG